MCLSLQVRAQTNPPKTYTAYKVNRPVEIDGLAKEKSWSDAPWSSDFVAIKGKKKPLYNTRFKMLWDAQYLYVYANIEEPHIWGTLKKRDTIIFYNNDFEMFIDPDGDTHNYIELEINALNTVWDLFLTKPYREGGKILDNWDIKGLISAVSYKGTLNDPSDVDTSWSLEMAIPWESLTEAGDSIPANNFWRINFSRVQWQFDLEQKRYQRKRDSAGNYLDECNWVWSPQGVVNMHEPEHWGYVYFSTILVSKHKRHDFEIPMDENIKWKMYQLYRAQKSYYHVHQRWAASISDLTFEPLTVDGVLLKPQLQLHDTGYNITIQSPFTSNILTLREDGYFTTKTIH